MVHHARWAWAPALLACSVVAGLAPLSYAQKQTPPRTVKDDAGLFSQKAKDRANADIAEIKTRFHKDLFIETLANAPKLPDSIDATNKKAVDQFYADWARKNFGNLLIDGIYVVITKEPRRLQIQVGKKTLDLGQFTVQNRGELRKLMTAKLAKDPDAALTEATASVRSVLAGNSRSVPAQNPAVNRDSGRGQAPAQAETEEIPWVKYVLIVLAVLVVVWIIFAILRALSGAGRGAGYAGAQGGGGGGGGGGGFFSSLMGGLFGAAAGMWLYNNFFGGHTATAHGGQPGATGGGTSAEPTDVGAGSSGEGGDWGGDDAGGGDAGGGDAGGGGDWGGDAGGGGDWGGGGGGGGDWGGGGGDFGGGGGDW